MATNHSAAANSATRLVLGICGHRRGVAGRNRSARTSGMKTAAVFLLLVSGLWVHAAESVTTNLVVTPSEVDPKSVRPTAAESPQPNVTFNFLSKTPEQVRAMYRRLPPVHVVKDGVVVAKALGCTGYKGRIAPDGQMVFSGLVLVFDDLEQARIAERVLKREDRKPE
jgi:hypothetical protein